VGVADPIPCEGRVVPASVADGVLDRVDIWQRQHLPGRPGVLNDAVVVDDEHGALDQFLADVVLEGDAVLLGDAPARIREERNVEVVLLGEGPVTVQRIGANPEHAHVFLHREQVEFVQIGLLVTGWIEIARVERQDHHVFAQELLECHASVVPVHQRRQFEPRRFVAL